MPALLVITGPPGAGKTTVARLVAERFEPSVLIAGDAFFAFLARGAIPPWLPEAHHQNDTVIRAAGAATGTYASARFHTIYEGILGPWFLPTFATAAGTHTHTHTLDYVMLLPSLDDCLERLQTRRGHSFHDEDATRALHHEFRSSAIEPRHLISKPTEEPEALAEHILTEAPGGRFTFRANDH